MDIIYSGTATSTIRGPDSTDSPVFTLGAAEFRIKGGSTATIPGTADTLLVQEMAGTFNSSVVSFVRLAEPSYTYPATIGFAAAGIAEVIEGNKIGSLAAGNTTLLVKNRFTEVGVYFGAGYTAIATFKRAVSYKAGSLAAHIVSGMNALLSGRTFANCSPYSTNNYSLTAPSVTRNTSFFMSALDTTAIPVINSTTAVSGVGGYIHPGVLITPRHLFGAHHFPPGGGVGGTVIFKGASGAYYTRTILSKLSQEQVVANSDIWVGLLDSALPADVTPVKAIPANWRNFIPSLDGLNENYAQSSIPTITKVAHTETTANGDRFGCSYLYYLAAADPLFANYGDAIANNLKYDGSLIVSVGSYSALMQSAISGDSGSPIFLLVNGKLVLITTHYTGFAGPTVGGSSAQINTAITTLATNAVPSDVTPYALDQMNFGAEGFTSYV